MSKCNCHSGTPAYYFIVYREKEAIHTEMKPFDYRMADAVWCKAAPQENPYPELRGASYPQLSSGLSGDLCQQLLRQELRHTSELLALLEKSLAQSL